MNRVIPWLALSFVFCLRCSAFALSLSSPNIPLDSPAYLYIEKLSGFGLVTGDFKGIRPYSRSEAARLLLEAEEKLRSGSYPPLAGELVTRLRELLPREAALREHPAQAPLFDYNPIVDARLRYLNLHGPARSYERPIHDAGGEWIFPLPQSRITYAYPRIFQQHGTEGTPLMENNEGVAYGSGSNVQGSWSSEAYLGRWASALVEPLFLISGDTSYLHLNKGYLKVGGGAAELEVGRDANWLGFGYRGTVILTNNARNFAEVKLSSPEPVDVPWFWDFKYDLVCSRFDRTVSAGVERQPYFYALKLSMKPTRNLEWALNLGRQVGGPGTGLDNSWGATLRGIIGATNSDNTNTLAGGELRLRLPSLWNVELYGEFSGEDRSDYWPMATSYVAGVLIPRIGREGRDDLRIEYFLGHPILYASATFPAGYLYHNYPIGHSQGGATQDLFLRYSHWFSARNIVALEGIYTTRGNLGRVPVDASGAFAEGGRMQALESKYAVRGTWRLPVYGDWDATLMYGYEKVDNLNLVEGAQGENQVMRVDLSYRY